MAEQTRHLEYKNLPPGDRNRQLFSLFSKLTETNKFYDLSTRLGLDLKGITGHTTRKSLKAEAKELLSLSNTTEYGQIAILLLFNEGNIVNLETDPFDPLYTEKPETYVDVFDWKTPGEPGLFALEGAKEIERKLYKRFMRYEMFQYQQAEDENVDLGEGIVREYEAAKSRILLGEGDQNMDKELVEALENFYLQIRLRKEWRAGYIAQFDDEP